MRQLTFVALMLSLGVAGLSAQQPAQEHTPGRRVKMKFSGSILATTLGIAPDTLNHEEHLTGNSSLGPFTFRGLWADDPGSVTVGSCGSGFGPNFRLVAGGGVFRFQDGSLLTVTLTEGALCVDIADAQHPVGHLIETHQITGGTGRFKDASANCGVTAGDCTLEVVATLGVILRDSSGAVKFLTTLGEIRGTVPRLAKGDEGQ
jgi:hypothetical protein